VNSPMSHFLSAAKRKLKGRKRPPQSEAATSVASLAYSSNSNNPHEDLYSTIGRIGIKVVSNPSQAELEYAPQIIAFPKHTEM